MRANRWLLDFGSSTCRLIDGKGQLQVLPSVAVVKDQELLFSGNEAWQLIGKVPADARLVFPIQRGRVAEPKDAGLFLHALAQASQGNWWERIIPAKHAVLVASDLSVIERNHWRQLLEKSLGGSWQLVDRSLALHRQLAKTASTNKQLIIEIGGQVTEIAIFQDQIKIHSGSLDWGSVELTALIQRQIAAIYQVAISWQTAEMIKHELAFLPQTRRPVVGKLAVRGKHLISEQGETLVVEASQLAPAFEQAVDKLADGIKLYLSEISTEVASEVLTDGVTLAGGGALLLGLSERLSDLLQTSVTLMSKPQQAAIMGLQLLV